MPNQVHDSTPPDDASTVPALDRAEAAEAGTALIGHLDPERTDRFDLPATADGNNAEAVGEEWNRISARLAELFLAGVPGEDPRAQQIAGEHYRWICRFWAPDRDSYLRLAAMYVSQPKFRKRIERKKPAGLAAYLRDAMTAYAHSQLR